MIELPEALCLADQITETLVGKRIADVTVANSPHKFAWFYGDRSRYSELLEGATVERARAFGGFVEIDAGEASILFGEGVNLRFHDTGKPRPAKHQFLIEFEDRSALSATVQMYGGMGAFVPGDLDNKYYIMAREGPSPLSKEFDREHLLSIVSASEVQNLSLKALLATEQRIPGLGNGVLQDILFNSRLHPKKKAGSLCESEKKQLFESVKGTLTAMRERGGRDTEMDLFGRAGGYQTILSKKTVGEPCPVCGTAITKETYLGGSIYYCQKCQRL